MQSGKFHKDTKWLISFRHGEERGFDLFFKIYYKAAFFFAFKYVKEKEAAEDIVENSFIKLWEKREQMECEPGLKAYLYKTIYHGCLRWLENERRKEKIYKIYKVYNEVQENGHIENMIRTETLRRVVLAMDELPEQCRRIFVKLYIEGKSVKETAEELQLTISTINNQKARGVKLLRMKFGLSFIICCCFLA